MAREAEFLHSGQQVLEEFRTVTTDFVGIDGRRDAMANFASMMQILIAGYEQQVNQSQGASQNAVILTSAVEMAAECTNEAADSTTYSSVHGMDGADGGGPAFNTTFAWDLSFDTFWDDMLENFTMIPFSQDWDHVTA